MSSALDAIMASPTLRERALTNFAGEIGDQLAAPIRDLEQLIAGWTTAAGRGITPRNPIGNQDFVFADSPAIGASYSYTVDGSWTVFPLSVYCRVTTSAAPGTRYCVLEYQDGNQRRYLVAGTQAGLAPSQQNAFCWHPLAGDVAWPIDDAALAPLPQQYLPPTHSLVIRVTGMDPGDQIDQVRLTLERYRMAELT